MAATLAAESSPSLVCAWLVGKKPDFAKYCQSVLENDVTGSSVLFAPMDDLLTMMGVISVGHKHLLRKEITALRSQVIPSLDEETEPSSEPIKQEQVISFFYKFLTLAYCPGKAFGTCPTR
jgi:hypothetical protein